MSLNYATYYLIYYNGSAQPARLQSLILGGAAISIFIIATYRPQTQNTKEMATLSIAEGLVIGF